MQKLQQLIESVDIESPNLVGVVVAAMREHFGADISFLSEFRKDLKVIRNIAGKEKNEIIDKGSSFPLDDTYCYRMASGSLPNLIQNACGNDQVNELAITRQLNIATYIGVPVLLPGGRTFGSLCCIFHNVENSIHHRDLRFMHVLADILSHQIAAEETYTEELREKRARIEEIIATQAMRMVFQPIVELATGKIVGVEALARFDAKPQRTPDVWFAEGWEVGLGRELEMTAIKLAIAQQKQIPDGAYLSVNISPETLLSEPFFESLVMADSERIVVELTEHTVVEEYQPLMESISTLHGSGIRLAIDDVGAGYAGLGHIIRISPNVLKLDMSLVKGIANDGVKQALARSAVAFGSQVDMDLVAEGIETAEDAQTLLSLGVRHGQGYYYGKPGDLSLLDKIDQVRPS